MNTQAQQEIIEEFALFDDWMDKYEHLIGLGICKSSYSYPALWFRGF